MKCPKRVPLQTEKGLYHKPLFFLSFCPYRGVSFVADGLMAHYPYLHRNKSGSPTVLPQRPFVHPQQYKKHVGVQRAGLRSGTATLTHT